MLEIILGWKGKSTQHVKHYKILKLKVKNIFSCDFIQEVDSLKKCKHKMSKTKVQNIKVVLLIRFLRLQLFVYFCKRSICINLFVFGWYVGKLAIVQWVDKKSGLKDCLQLFFKANCHVG